MGSTFADSDYGDTVESQLTLGTASLLGIFFGLVMVCGIFFGFGYSIGRRNAASVAAISAPPARVTPAPVPAPMMAQPAANAAASLTTENASLAGTHLAPVPAAAPINLPAASLVAATPKVTGPVVSAPAANKVFAMTQPKPAAAASHPLLADNIRGSQTQVLPLTTADHAYVEPKPRAAKPSAIQPTLDQPATRIPLQRVVAGPQFTAQSLPTPYLVWTPPFDVHYRKGFKHSLTQAASHAPQTGVTHPSGAYASAQPAMPHLSPSSPAMTVQVAALSRQDDAEVLVSALRQRGFAPSIQSGSEDALYHVQVGPFSRDVAFATRQRLIARGYNATLK